MEVFAPGHRHDRAGVSHHVLDAPHRVGEVHREVRGPGLHHGESDDHQVDGPGQRDRDHRFGTGAPLRQHPCHPVDPLPERRVVQDLVATGDGRCRGTRGDLLGEEFRDRPRNRARALVRPGPRDGQLFLGGEHGQPGDGPVRLGGDGLQHRAQLVGNPGRRRIGEQRGVVRQGTDQLPIRLAEVEHQVEAGGENGRFHLPSRDPRQVEGTEVHVVQVDSHVHQRGTTGIAFGGEHLHQLLERDILVGERVQHCAANL